MPYDNEADPVYAEKALWPTQRLKLEYMGLEVQPPFIAYAAPRVDAAMRLRYLSGWKSAVGNMLTRPA